MGFLISCIRDIGEICHNAWIEFEALGQFPLSEIVKLLATAPILEDKAILTFINGQNKELGVEDWLIVRERAKEKGQEKNF